MRGPEPRHVAPASTAAAVLGRREAPSGPMTIVRGGGSSPPAAAVVALESRTDPAPARPPAAPAPGPRDDPPLRLLGRLARDRPQPLEPARRRSRAIERSVTTSWNAATPTSVPCWTTCSSASPFRSACTTVSRWPRLTDRPDAPLLDDALGALEPAERLGPVAGQEHDPIAVAQAQHRADLALDRGRQRKPVAGDLRRSTKKRWSVIAGLEPERDPLAVVRPLDDGEPGRLERRDHLVGAIR